MSCASSGRLVCVPQIGNSVGVPPGITSQTWTQPVGLGQWTGKQTSTHGYIYYASA